MCAYELLKMKYSSNFCLKIKVSSTDEDLREIVNIFESIFFKRSLVDQITLERWWRSHAEMYCLYDHIKLATEVIPGSDYSIFKKGIRPMWEDKMNEKGGRWIIKLDRPRSSDLNEMWLDVIMLMIGERFHENEDEICGAILNVRARCDKISVWTSNVNKKKHILQIGRKLKECLNYAKDLKLHYESHESVEKKTTKNRYLYTL